MTTMVHTRPAADAIALVEPPCTTHPDGYLDIHSRMREWTQRNNTVFDVLQETVAAELRWRATVRMSPQSAPRFEALT